MKWIKRILITLTVLYVLACGILYLYQDRIIFFPEPRAADHVYGGEGSEVTLTAEDGTELNALYVQRPGATGTVLFLHGNRGDNGRALHQARPVLDQQQNLLLLDYRGFGKSGGVIRSQRQLYADAQLAYDWLKARTPESKITLIGYSLGTGMVSHLAAENEPRQLVLVAPYLSLRAMKNLWFWMTPDFLLRYDLDNTEQLPRTNCPVYLLHGDQDRLIPYAMAEELVALDPERIELRTVKGGSHRSVILSNTFRRLVSDILP